MDVFIPEEYVIRRRLEKKAATTCGKGSKSHSSMDSNRSEVSENKASSSYKGFGLVDEAFASRKILVELGYSQSALSRSQS
ncbi:unnamed protein product [Lupinus luteus]|uniref:Uncharacterized protein n=1 Tax=Lupinus luteus TaxID=3873 RepID=A0AAV1YCE3_LUPLU